jgi:uncharacterized protein YciI
VEEDLTVPYFVETWDKPDSLSLRRQTRPEHLRFLEANKAKLLACGAKLQDDGSDAGGGVYILDVETRAEAEALVAADPYSEVGLFQRVSITRWRKAYVDGRNYLD